jgi:hypothetical protein
METGPVSKTLCSLGFRIPDDGQSPPPHKEKNGSSKCYTPLPEPFKIYLYSKFSTHVAIKRNSIAGE